MFFFPFNSQAKLVLFYFFPFHLFCPFLIIKKRRKRKKNPAFSCSAAFAIWVFNGYVVTDNALLWYPHPLTHPSPPPPYSYFGAMLDSFQNSCVYIGSQYYVMPTSLFKFIFSFSVKFSLPFIWKWVLCLIVLDVLMDMNGRLGWGKWYVNETEIIFVLNVMSIKRV